MALIDITPVMTSNNSPAPYVTSGSGVTTSKYDYYKAFNNTLDDVNDAWASNTTTGWLKIDFGEVIRIDAFSLYTRVHPAGVTNDAPKNYTLYGSNDDLNYEQILSVTDQIYWVATESRLHKLPSPVGFRYYRINATANNGNTTILTIGLLKFWQDDGVVEYVDNKKASLNYCLPRNTTLAMKAKQNDPREGLLGFANDPVNYGTLYMVDNKGQAIIPKASMSEPELIFDGVANTALVEYKMVESYKKYKYLLVECGVHDGTLIKTNIIIKTSNIVGLSQEFNIGSFYQSTHSILIVFTFNTETSFKIDAFRLIGYKDPAITKIYGIK